MTTPPGPASGHTPGPWFIGKKGGPFCVDASSGEEGSDFRIAKTYASPFAPDQAQSAANARLIAASPDLLAACRAAFERLKADGDPFAGPDWELGHRLSAAIGKATDPEYPR
jgi:hypothetical protein